MSNVKKSIAELNLIEDFLFTEASIDVKTSELLMRLIIERVVGKKVGKLIIEPQKTLNGIDTDSHGIRMDVSIKEVEENPEIEYNDGVRKIFLYTGGKKGGTQSLKDLLLYLENSVEENAVDEELKQLHVNVTRLKENRKIGVKYMQMQEVIKYKVEELLEEAVEKAVEEAVETTEQRMAKLNQILLRDKRYEELEKISVDADYRKKLMEDYNI